MNSREFSVQDRERLSLPWLLLAVAFLAAAPAFAGVNRWTSHGPEGQAVSALAIDPLKPTTLYAGTRNGGVFKSSDGGASWGDPSNGELDGVNIHSLAIDPMTPSSVYAGTSDGVSRSADGGASWSSRLLAGAIYNLVVGSEKPSTIYAGDFDDVGYYPAPSAVYKSTDDGESWTQSASHFSIVPGTLVIDPTQPSTVYAATYDSGGVFKSVNGGSTWSFPSGGLNGVFVDALAIDPRDPATLYAGTYSGIFKSVDAGSTWRLASGDLARYGVNALAIDPRDPRTLYAGHQRGVFRSTDAGTTWAPFNEGLSNLGVKALAIDRSGTLLHAATASGVFDFEVAAALFDVSVTPDGSTRFFSFDLSSGRIVLGSVDSSQQTTRSQPFGPYDRWIPRASATGGDGLTRVLWTHQDGSAALWLVGGLGVRASFRYEAIPGLAAVDVAAGAGSETHILWTGDDGTVVLQTIDGSGAITNQLALGPYARWSATAIADGPDGLTRLLWNNRDGRAGLSLASNEGILTTSRYAAVDGWTTLDVAVGGDGLTRILRASGDGRFALRVVDAAGEITTDGAIYPAPEGMTARRIATGADGSSRVLFTYPGGDAALVFLSAAGAYEGLVPLTGNFPLPPNSTWTGRFIWVSATASRALCPEITSQVGSTFPLWIGVQIEGSTVTLRLSEGPPSNDFMDAPAVFLGTIIGDSITASNASPSGGFACPADKTITRQTGGDLRATLAGRTIAGEYTEIFGTGADSVTLLFRFMADLDEASSSKESAAKR